MLTLRSAFFLADPGCPVQQLSFFLPFVSSSLRILLIKESSSPCPPPVFSNSIKACC